MLSRWKTLLSVVTQDCLAATLVEDGVAILDGAAGSRLSTFDLVMDGVGEERANWHRGGADESVSDSDEDAVVCGTPSEGGSGGDPLSRMAESAATTQRGTADAAD